MSCLSIGSYAEAVRVLRHGWRYIPGGGTYHGGMRSHAYPAGPMLKTFAPCDMGGGTYQEEVPATEECEVMLILRALC